MISALVAARLLAAVMPTHEIPTLDAAAVAQGGTLGDLTSCADATHKLDRFRPHVFSVDMLCNVSASAGDMLRECRLLSGRGYAKARLLHIGVCDSEYYHVSLPPGISKARVRFHVGHLGADGQGHDAWVFPSQRN